MRLIFIIIAFLVVGGIGIPLFSYIKEQKAEKAKGTTSKGKSNNSTNDHENEGRNIDVDNDVNVRNTDYLLEFDSIEVCNEHEALVKINDDEYVAYLEVGGVSFNLLSENEKIILEENYGNLLNGIDYEFQNYIQSRGLNLDTYLKRYEERLSTIVDKMNVVEEKIDFASDEVEKKKYLLQYNRLSNQLEYGKNLLQDFKVRNIDSYLLERKFYIILKYYHDNDGYNDLTQREVLEYAYNDLTMKANLFIDTLERNGMTCKFLNGVEIAEVIYNSFNKEDASALRLESAIKAKFNHLCTTSKPIYQKKIDEEKRRVSEEQQELAKNIKKISDERNKVLLEEVE